MTARNSILLMVKQSPGITYNSLLGKIASDFGSVNSARASLSRTLKDSVSFGLLKKRDNFYFLTDKGNSTISFEMKNKLLMKLNTSISSSKKINELDLIVEQLHNVIERSKNDADLLKAAKNSSTFFISDLVKLNADTNEKINHLAYLSGILSKQVNSLMELNFNDLIILKKEAISVKKIVSFFSGFDLNEFFVECPESIFEAVSEKFSVKSKNPSFSLKKELLKNFLGFVFSLKLPQSETIKVYFSSIQIKITVNSVLISGPFTEIKKLK